MTGADGFVGSWLVPELLAAGYEVSGTLRAGGSPPFRLSLAERRAVQWVPLELEDPNSVDRCAAFGGDAVIHLAAVASVRESRQDPGRAYAINTAGTGRLAHALGERHRGLGRTTRLVLVSSGEVYGPGDPLPRREGDPIRPVSSYAASKAGAEIAALEVWRRTGLPVVVARPFPHTGPGQSADFVVPAFAARLAEAKRLGATTIRTGNLEPVRDLLDVRDVARGYVALLSQGVPGETYNVASGAGFALVDVLARLARLVGVNVTPIPDPSLVREIDIPHLVGDARKLREATGWAPRIPLDQTFRDLIDAQTD